MRKLITIIALLFFPGLLLAAGVHLRWDPSVSPGVTGYKVYFGNASRTYGTPIKIANVTEYTVTNLSDGTWFFAVTATDDNGNESGFSNEVSKVINTLANPGNLEGEIEGPAGSAVLIIPSPKEGETLILKASYKAKSTEDN